MTVYMIFGMFFVGELFVFPLYLRHLKDVSLQSHNYEKGAMILFVLYTLVRSMLRGWQKSLCMVLLFVAIETAKSIVVMIRYFKNRHKRHERREEKQYEIVEEYDLQPLIERLQSISEPVVELVYDDVEMSRYHSQLGGLPYWPKGKDYPTSMQLLVQINFEELEENIEGLPHHGILQFFIVCDDMYGCDFDDPMNCSGFQVVYHPHIEHQLADIESSMRGPILQPSRLRLSIRHEINLSFSDIEFYEKLEHYCGDLLIPDYQENSVFMEQLYEALDMSLYNKMKGRGDFVQDDPRVGNFQDYDFLLLQLVSDDKHMMWGDHGTCHFFMKKEDLKKLDFRQVMYTWESY